MAISSSILKRISEVSIFTGLGPAEIEELALTSTRKKFTSDIKFSFSDVEENCFFIVNEGRAIIKTQDSSGQGTVVGFLEPGDFFGEISVIESISLPYDIFAGNSGAEILVFLQKDFTDILLNYPSIHMALSREFSRRLRIINNKIGFLPTTNSLRIGMALFSLAKSHGTLTSEGILLPKISQGELSKLSDATKEIINIVFADLKNLGLIKPTESKQILIPNIHELENWIKKNYR